MNKVEKLNLIIKMYQDGQYDTDTFADVFSYTYGKESNDNCDRAVLDKYNNLFMITSRYSPYEDEISLYPNVYCSKQDILDALDLLKSKL